MHAYVASDARAKWPEGTGAMLVAARGLAPLHGAAWTTHGRGGARSTSEAPSTPGLRGVREVHGVAGQCSGCRVLWSSELGQGPPGSDAGSHGAPWPPRCSVLLGRPPVAVGARAAHACKRGYRRTDRAAVQAWTCSAGSQNTRRRTAAHRTCWRWCTARKGCARSRRWQAAPSAMSHAHHSTRRRTPAWGPRSPVRPFPSPRMHGARRVHATHA
jgi:hypothetical protein